MDKFKVDKETLYPIIADLRVYKTKEELDVLRFANQVSLLPPQVINTHALDPRTCAPSSCHPPLTFPSSLLTDAAAVLRTLPLAPSRPSSLRRFRVQMSSEGHVETMRRIKPGMYEVRLAPPTLDAARARQRG